MTRCSSFTQCGGPHHCEVKLSPDSPLPGPQGSVAAERRLSGGADTEGTWAEDGLGNTGREMLSHRVHTAPASWSELSRTAMEPGMSVASMRQHLSSSMENSSVIYDSNEMKYDIQGAKGVLVFRRQTAFDSSPSEVIKILLATKFKNCPLCRETESLGDEFFKIQMCIEIKKDIYATGQ